MLIERMMMVKRSLDLAEGLSTIFMWQFNCHFLHKCSGKSHHKARANVESCLYLPEGWICLNQAWALLWQGCGSLYPNYDVTSWTPSPCRKFWLPRVQYEPPSWNSWKTFLLVYINFESSQINVHQRIIGFCIFILFPILVRRHGVI